ncbi:MAG TPA: nuclear transport factor 2 family protein [Bacteroidota bacterium]|nr:nuclear transport factor 2 family protein [Bacteroidota bacterium]
MSPSSEPASLARKCIDLFNRHSLEWVDTCYAKDVDWNELPLPTSPNGHHGDRALLRESAARVLSIFPDRGMSVERIVAEGDCVAMELVWMGTASATIGPLQKGTQLQYRIASFLTIRDGLITRQIDYCVPLRSSNP